MPKYKFSSFQLIVILVSLFAIGSAFGFVSTPHESADTVYVIQKSPITQQQSSAMKLPAISVQNDTGVSAYLEVTARPGSGNIFVNLENILVSPETQHSARFAASIASNLTGIRIDKVDIVYDMHADASILEGPSAGAAFTIATMAALENRGIRQDVMITGMVNHDGTIGPAGKIFEKALAAREAGAKVLLVPVGAATEINYTETEYCSTWGQKEYCQPEFMPKIRDISKETGIQVIEVRTIEEASKHFFN